MAEAKKLKNIKRFGSRYGRKTKQRFGTIEEQQRKKHKCPYCNSESAKRISTGIWGCRKCGSKFTGKAYTIGKKAVSKEEAEESPEIIEEELPEEEQEEKEEEE